MNSRQALTKARKLWGPRAHIEERPNAPRREERAQADADLKEHRDRKPVRPAHKLGEPDTPEMAAYRVAYREWKARENNLLGTAVSFPRAVGLVVHIAGIVMFNVKAQGDTWDDCFEKAAQAEAMERERAARLKKEAQS